MTRRSLSAWGCGLLEVTTLPEPLRPCTSRRQAWITAECEQIVDSDLLTDGTRPMVKTSHIMYCHKIQQMVQLQYHFGLKIKISFGIHIKIDLCLYVNRCPCLYSYITQHAFFFITILTFVKWTASWICTVFWYICTSLFLSQWSNIFIIYLNLQIISLGNKLVSNVRIMKIMPPTRSLSDRTRTSPTTDSTASMNKIFNHMHRFNSEYG